MTSESRIRETPALIVYIRHEAEKKADTQKYPVLL